MAVWFRRPNCMRLQQAGYGFWLRESYARITQNARSVWVDESKWDARLWVVLLIIVPLNYLIAPLCTCRLKSYVFGQLIDTRGLTLSSEVNIRLMRQWVRETEGA